MQPIARMVFGFLALTLGLVLIAASGPRVFADPAPLPTCNDLYEDTNTTPCLDTATVCEGQNETNCKVLSTTLDAKEVLSFPKQCVTKKDYLCEEKLQNCNRKVYCKWDATAKTCLQRVGGEAPWESKTKPVGTADCQKKGG